MRDNKDILNWKVILSSQRESKNCWLLYVNDDNKHSSVIIIIIIIIIMNIIISINKDLIQIFSENEWSWIIYGDKYHQHYCYHYIIAYYAYAKYYYILFSQICFLLWLSLIFKAKDEDGFVV